MSDLSDKKLLEVLAEFPKHELTTLQRTKMLKILSETAIKKPKKPFHFQRVAAFMAVLILLLIAPILYLANKPEDKSINSGAAVEKALEGNYFALVDKDGPHYVDSNFGIPNKVSLLAPKEWVAYDNRGTSKIMVFLWGKEFDENPILNIDATHVDTGIKEHLINVPLSAGMYGADAHAVTNFQSFDKAGKWNLEFTVYNTKGEKKKVGAFSIYVKAPYVMVGRSATLMISQEDLYAGFYEDATIEVVGDNLPNELDLEINNEDDPSDQSVFTFRDKSDYTTTEGKKVSLYTGDFQIKKSGRYSFGVMGTANLVTVGKPTDQ